MDYTADFNLAGLLAKYWEGSITWAELNGMTRREMLWYYAIYERQVVEEEIRNEHLSPAKGKPRKLPSPARMAELVAERIAEYHKK